MSSYIDGLSSIWLIQTSGRDGPGLWMVGSNTAAEAIEMVDRNIGDLITGMRQVVNEARVAFGELRMARVGARFEP